MDGEPHRLSARSKKLRSRNGGQSSRRLTVEWATHCLGRVSGSSTFETCRRTLRMSVDGEDREESSDDGQNDANDPRRTLRVGSVVAVISSEDVAWVSAVSKNSVFRENRFFLAVPRRT